MFDGSTRRRGPRGVPARVLVASLPLICAGLAGCTVRPEGYEIDGTDVQAVFMHSSDIHSRLLPYRMDVLLTDETLGLKQQYAPFGGMARLAAVVRQERKDNPRMAHVDSGDVFQGAPIFNSFGGEPEFRAMTQLGVDAFAIGNHEFDSGTDHFITMADKYANFPLLAANYALGSPKFTGNIASGRVAKPYTIINLRGLRVAVIGLGYVGGSPFYGGANQGVVPLQIKEELQKYVDFLRPLVDVVTVVTHSGYHEDIEYIPRTEGIDIVFGGHLHIVLNPPSVIQDCDVARLKRERDRYICNTPEKLRVVERACESKNSCSSKPAAEQASCSAACKQEAADACKRESEVRHYGERLAELDADIRFLEKRGCHPRDVLLVHSGAFLKFIGKLEVTFKQCQRMEPSLVCAEQNAAGQCLRKVPRRCTGNASGKNDWDVAAHKYTLIPVDKRLPEDGQMLRLLEPYILELSRQQHLTKLVGYTRTTLKRFSAGSGDSQLGNLVTEAMLDRNQVWADFAMTNSLGIRSDMVHGPVDEEQMTNVFPFDNSITTMFLTGYQVQELMDFVAQKSAIRGCQSQAQVSGITATLNCGGCAGKGGNACARASYAGQPCAQRVTIGGTGRACKEDKDCATTSGGQLTGEICTGQFHPDQASNPSAKRCGLPITCSRSYLLATNDYMAYGGSGFAVLGQTTTQKNLYIRLRQAAAEYIARMRGCAYVPRSFTERMQGKAYRSVLDAQDAQTLKEMEKRALSGKAADVKAANDAYTALRKKLTDRLATAKSDLNLMAGLLNYLGCSSETVLTDETCDGLACILVRECRTAKVKDLARCEALGRVRAALRCIALPCIEANEDGRVQRVFRDSSGSPNPFEPWPE